MTHYVSLLGTAANAFPASFKGASQLDKSEAHRPAVSPNGNVPSSRDTGSWDERRARQIIGKETNHYIKPSKQAVETFVKTTRTPLTYPS